MFVGSHVQKIGKGSGIYDLPKPDPTDWLFGGLIPHFFLGHRSFQKPVAISPGFLVVF